MMLANRWQMERLESFVDGVMILSCFLATGIARQPLRINLLVAGGDQVIWAIAIATGISGLLVVVTM